MNQNKRRKQVGDRGEDLAADYLSRNGFLLIERNFYTKLGEIDLIARDGTVLVFVEIKTCTSDSFGPPETWVTPRKQKRIAAAALAYIHRHKLENTACRFDVVTIDLRIKGDQGIHHIVDAFWMPDMEGMF